MRKLWRTLKENWASYIFELLIIVLGISISFYVDSIREDAQEQKEKEKIEAENRKVELQYLNSLKADIEKDMVQLDSLSAKAGKIQMTLYQFRRHLNQDTFDVDQVYADLYEIANYQNFYANAATYNALLSSDGFTKINNYRLKESLFELHHLYQSLTRHDDEYQQATQLLYDYLLDRMDNSAFEMIFRKIALKTNPKFEADAKIFLNDDRFANRLRRLNYIYYLTVDYAKAKTMTNEILLLLKVEIEN